MSPWPMITMDVPFNVHQPREASIFSWRITWGLEFDQFRFNWYLYVVSVRRPVIGIESWIEDTKETPRWVTVGCPSSCRFPDGTTVVKIQHQWPNPSQRRVRFHLVPHYLILHSRCPCSRSWMEGVWLLVKNPFDFPISLLCVPVS